MAGIKLIVVTALLVVTVKCDYNPGGGNNYLPTRRGHGSDTQNGFGLMEQGIGYGRDSGYGRTHSDGYGYGANNVHHDSYEANSPQQPYQFGYAVKDYHTGNDFKQQEHSDGNTVKGQYRVLLPDGRTQIVTYTADWQTGFHADVKYEGEAVYPSNNYGHGGGSTYGVPGIGVGSGGGYGGSSGGHGGYSGGSSYNNVGGGSGGHFGGPSSSYGPPGYKK